MAKKFRPAKLYAVLNYVALTKVMALMCQKYKSFLFLELCLVQMKGYQPISIKNFVRFLLRLKSG